jgi:unsaturated chondroitin disaccharide hydrolase
MLTAAEAVSAYWLKTVPSGGVPNWDFAAPTPTFADTSAAAIVASAFVELSTFTKNPKYRTEATAIVNTLTTNPAFVSPASTSYAVTKGNGHDCGAADCTIIEPEYYLLEAIRRLAPSSTGTN